MLLPAKMLLKKYEAWHWKVMTIDGNDPDAIRAALTEAKAVTGQPTLIIGKTVMGKGARKADNSSYERNCGTHGAPLGGEAYINTIKIWVATLKIHSRFLLK